MAKTARALPKLHELHHDPDVAFKNDEFNYLVNQQPFEKWIKRHPIVTVLNDEGKNVKLQYLPVEKVELLLTRIFQQWKREVKDIQLVLNSIVATVRLWYLHPVSGEWEFHDGVGACPIQTKSGAAAGDFSQLQTSGVQMAAPAAVSYALKDAAECIGKLFGKDLNRRDTSAFSGAYGQVIKKIEEVLEEDLAKPIKQADIKATYTPLPPETDNEFEM
jgi:hypothetical protein